MLFQLQFLGLVDPDLIDVIRKVFAGLFFEHAGKVAWALEDAGSNILQRQIGLEVLLDERKGMLHFTADVGSLTGTAFDVLFKDRNNPEFDFVQVSEAVDFAEIDLVQGVDGCLIRPPVNNGTRNQNDQLNDADFLAIPVFSGGQNVLIQYFDHDLDGFADLS